MFQDSVNTALHMLCVACMSCWNRLLLRSLRLYILKQLSFLISVNSSRTFTSPLCHYSPRFQRIILNYQTCLYLFYFWGKGLISCLFKESWRTNPCYRFAMCRWNQFNEAESCLFRPYSWQNRRHILFKVANVPDRRNLRFSDRFEKVVQDSWGFKSLFVFVVTIRICRGVLKHWTLCSPR